MIFTQSLQRIDASNPQEAIKKMVAHIKYIQEQLEYTLTNLDSRNIVEIDTDKTAIADAEGSNSLGSYIKLTGKNGESFTVGKNSRGRFEFAVNDGKGKVAMYMDSEGKMVITEETSITFDGGEW